MKTIWKIALPLWAAAALACGGSDGSDGMGIWKDDWGGDALLLRYANTDVSAFYPWNMD
jgi:hypothetical protein